MEPIPDTVLVAKNLKPVRQGVMDLQLLGQQVPRAASPGKGPGAPHSRSPNLTGPRGVPCG